MIDWHIILDFSMSRLLAHFDIHGHKKRRKLVEDTKSSLSRRCSCRANKQESLHIYLMAQESGLGIWGMVHRASQVNEALAAYR
jgi:hypothetical protein